MHVHIFFLPNHDTNLVITAFGYMFLGINLDANFYDLISYFLGPSKPYYPEDDFKFFKSI